MITLNPVLQYLLNKSITEVFYLVRIRNDEYKVLFTSWYQDFTLKNNGTIIYTYLSDGRLIKLDPPAVTDSVDRNKYQIYIADPAFYDGQVAEIEWINHEVEIRAAFINNEFENKTDSAGHVVAPGQPYMEIDDTFLIYKGIVDEIQYQINTESLGESVAVISCSSPMYNLDFKRTFRLNRDFVRNRHSNDSCCDNVFEGSSKVKLTWGKA